MTARITLQRSGPMPFAPAPKAVCAGDYVFTSTIYPVNADGHAVTADELLGEAGPSLIATQARHCLETLKAILKEHKTPLDRVLKAEVHLAAPEDFYEFKLVWREYFPSDPPARTTVEVGDTFPFRGVRLSLDAVALAGASKLERQVLRDPDGPDPMETEAAPHAVRAGPLVFCSGFTASNFKTGLAAGRRPGFPNYDNDAALQADHFFTTLNRVLSQAGTSLEHALEFVSLRAGPADVLGGRQRVAPLHAGTARPRLHGHQGPHRPRRVLCRQPHGPGPGQ